MALSISILLVSKISSMTRIGYLRECLLSIFNQTSQRWKLSVFVSFAVSDENIIRETEQVLQGLPNSDRYSWQTSNEPKSQFEGFKILVDALTRQDRQALANWIMLADDDDLWHPQRIDRYLEIIDHQAKANAALVIVNRFVRSKDPQPNSVNDVCVNSLTFRDNDSDKGSSPEFWLFCVKVWLLQAFFQCCLPKLRHHKFCDRFFASFAWNYRNLMILRYDLTSLPEAEWMYFYRKHQESTTASAAQASQCNVDPVLKRKILDAYGLADEYFRNVIDTLEQNTILTVTNTKQSADLRGLEFSLETYSEKLKCDLFRIARDIVRDLKPEIIKLKTFYDYATLVEQALSDQILILEHLF